MINYIPKLETCRKTTKRTIIEICELPKYYEDLMIDFYITYDDLQKNERVEEIANKYGKEPHTIDNDLVKARTRFNTIIEFEFDFMSVYEKKYAGRIRGLN